MAEDDGIAWYKPHTRAIIPIGGFHASRSLRKSARKLEIEFDRDFEAIMEGCAQREETWISDEIRAAYQRLFQLGFARCCGAYQAGRLVGGVYAASFGLAMFAESMFHYETDAGKVALWKLVEQAEKEGCKLFEVQFLTPHLAGLGAIEIDDEAYMQLLSEAL